MAYNPSQIQSKIPVPSRKFWQSVNIKDEGADSTGKTECSAKINAAIKKVPITGGELIIPKGVYLIDPLTPVLFQSNMHVFFEDGAVFRAKPNNAPRYAVIELNDIENIVLEGNGTILGDRDYHTYTPQSTAALSTHEWGHCARVYSVRHASILGLEFRDGTGDGISISTRPNSGACDDVFVRLIKSINNRRQGVSVGKSSNVTLQECEFGNINGTDPQSGVDIEPDDGGFTDNVVVEDCYAHDCVGAGFQTYRSTRTTSSPITNVMLRRNRSELNAMGFYIQGADNVSILGNTIIRNRASGTAMASRAGPVAFHENTSGYNYTQNGVIERDDFEWTGYKTALQRDLYIRNNQTNDIGRNYYI
jgi:Endopolygalacturonase